jgi:hypothetical protein
VATTGTWPPPAAPAARWDPGRTTRSLLLLQPRRRRKVREEIERIRKKREERGRNL